MLTTYICICICLYIYTYVNDIYIYTYIYIIYVYIYIYKYVPYCLLPIGLAIPCRVATALMVVKLSRQSLM